MKQKRIYILHKNGANSHYTALNHLLSKNGIKLEYREFSVFSKLYKSVIKGDTNLFLKQITNLFFLINLIFTNNKKIVVGIAPFDSKLGGILKILKNHQIYYHSSWTFWDKSFHPKTKKNNLKVFKTWQTFLENHVKHVFAVTNQTKSQLLKNYNLKKEAISVVYHALENVQLNDCSQNRTPNSFIYLGRLVPQKGIEELLQFFSNNSNAQLTLVGNGHLEKLVKTYAQSNSNIHFKPFTKNKAKIYKTMQQHQYVVLNSKRTKKWEELFGLIIIEGMSQGLIPIAPTHSGPKEIISDNIGYLFEEGNITEMLSHIISLNEFNETMSKNAQLKSKTYLPENISEFWKPIIN